MPQSLGCCGMLAGGNERGAGLLVRGSCLSSQVATGALSSHLRPAFSAALLQEGYFMASNNRRIRRLVDPPSDEDKRSAYEVTANLYMQENQLTWNQTKYHLKKSGRVG